MLAHREKELRDRQADYDKRHYGLLEHANATDQNAYLAAEGKTLARTLPMGKPEVIQDAMGNVLQEPGLDGPAKPGS